MYVYIHTLSLLLYCAPAGRIHPRFLARPLPRAILEGPSWKIAAVLVDEASANSDMPSSNKASTKLLGIQYVTIRQGRYVPLPRRFMSACVPAPLV